LDLPAVGGHATVVGQQAQTGSGVETLAAIGTAIASNVSGSGAVTLNQSAGPATLQPSIGDQIADRVSASGAGAGQQITINLTPPELGKVRLVMQGDGDSVRCVLHVQSPGTMDQIRDQAPALVQRLAQSGVEVRRMDVFLDKAAADHQQRLPDSPISPARQWDSPSYGTFSDAQSGRQDSYSRRGDQNAAPQQPDPSQQEQVGAVAAPAAYVRDGGINTLI
jgi:hypothetical protein